MTTAEELADACDTIKAIYAVTQELPEPDIRHTLIEWADFAQKADAALTKIMELCEETPYV